ncbi:MAG: T9SS type A sorting domain-containing protein [Paludibacteraceae bacterium]|nr:T9SS type A sorting domain-containing protein [Paludibacteraceae bacterium]
MRNIFLLFLGLALMALPMRAQGAGQPVQRLIVWKMDGTKVYFELTDEPVTTFANGSLVITANNGVFSYPLAQMAKYTHEGLPEGIDLPTIAPGDVIVRQNNEMLQLEGLPDGMSVTVYSMEGKLVASQKAVGGQPTLLVLTAQPAGTYIVNAGSASFKFVKQ